MTYSLAGTRVLIVGGSSGIAAALAADLRQEGARVTLASALAVELAPTRVNAISPGVIGTSAWDSQVPDKQQVFQHVAATVPARRAGEPSDVSAAARALLANPFITGETLHVDGGAR
jgi:NAD(P)-dependent dehydrogenase (short-subunit alcohol dehydrogenase family)